MHDAAPPEEDNLPVGFRVFDEITCVLGELLRLIMKIVLRDACCRVDVLGGGVEDGGKEHVSGAGYTLGLRLELFLGEFIHLLHLFQVIAQTGVSLHHIAGKTVLLPGEAIEVWVRTTEGFCADLVPLGFLTDRWIGEAGEEVAAICIQPIEETCALGDILRGGLIIGLGFRREPIVELPKVEGKAAALVWTSDRIAGNGGAKGVRRFLLFYLFYLFTFKTVWMIFPSLSIIDILSCFLSAVNTEKPSAGLQNTVPSIGFTGRARDEEELTT